MTETLLPCPFCCDPMEDRGYGAVHIDGNGCAINGLAIDPEKWNRRAPSPSPKTVVSDLDIQIAYEAWIDRTVGARAPITAFYAGYRAALTTKGQP